MSKYAELEILPVNKSVVFYSPVEGTDVLVRTGTIGDGSCYYHSLLHAYSKDYVMMGESGRMKFVKRLRASMANKIDKTKWESISNGLIARLGFQEHVRNILEEFYQFIGGRDGGNMSKGTKIVINKLLESEDDLSIYKIIVDMMPFIESFEKNILPNTYAQTETQKISKVSSKMEEIGTEYYQEIFDNLREKVDKTRVTYFISKFITLIKQACIQADNSSYKEYVKGIQNSAINVDGYSIGLISNKFDRDIYFIDAKDRLPYRNGSTNQNIKNRKSIIVMWTGGVHYEIVGRLLPGNRIAREFDPEDPLIKRIRTFLIHPELVPRKYPNLIPYLPKSIRDSLGYSMSQRDIDYMVEKDYEASDNEDDQELEDMSGSE